MTSARDRAPVAVVTGASAGVGRATVRMLAARGDDIALLARGERGLEDAACEVRDAGRRALCVSVDVADTDAVDSAAAAAERELGPIDVWINNAMTTVFERVVDIEPADFRRAVDVTFLGQVWGTMAALRRMRPRDHGTIVNVGSALAYLGIPLQAPYCASKFRMPGVLRSLARRTDRRAERGPAADGAPAGGEHSAIRLVQDESRQTSTARAADLPAGGARGEDRRRR